MVMFDDGDEYKKVLKSPDETGLHGEELVRRLTEASLRHPSTALFYADHYMQHIPEHQRVDILSRAAKSNTHMALLAADNYIGYIPEHQRADLLIEAIKSNPGAALKRASDYMTHIPEDKRTNLILGAAGKAGSSTIFVYADNFMGYVPEDKRVDLLTKAINEGYSRTVLTCYERVAKFIPEKDRFTLPQHYADRLLDNMEGIEDIDNSLASAIPYIGEERVRLLRDLPEKKREALRTGERLNSDHELPDNQRFAPINDYTVSQLYNLITLGREELYTSSYMGVFNRLVDKLGQEHKTLFDIPESKYGKSLLVFLEAAATYNTLDKALPAIPPDKWGDILGRFGSQIEQSSPAYAVALADIMQKVSDPSVKVRMEQFVQDKIDQFSDTPGKESDIYGVLAAYYNEASGSEKFRLTDAERYRVGTHKQLSQSKLLGEDGIHRQLVVFTGDDDGERSHENFMKRYKNNKKYHVEDKGDYTKITPSNGAKMEIYANKPTKSPDEIIAALGEGAKFDAVVHRGHSYNLNNTMPYFSSENVLAFLGSCGGYQNIANLTKIAPDIEVTSTQRTGAMAVNDALLYHINEKIRTGKPVVWAEEQQYLESLNSPHKAGYVIPEQNIMLRIQKVLNRLADERERESAEQQDAVSLETLGAAREDLSRPNGIAIAALAASQQALHEPPAQDPRPHEEPATRQHEARTANTMWQRPREV